MLKKEEKNGIIKCSIKTTKGKKGWTKIETKQVDKNRNKEQGNSNIHGKYLPKYINNHFECQ